ncbi:MAG: XRE family transcriptional regulator [Bacteroidales bacterium]|nr:XRE family transcriptional regulator [Bacteroidales bacterium]
MEIKEKPFIGKIIKGKLKEQGRTVTWLAARLSCTRENLYNVFSKSDINTQMLFQISKELNYDFFKEFSNCLQLKK